VNLAKSAFTNGSSASHRLFSFSIHRLFLLAGTVGKNPNSEQGKIHEPRCSRRLFSFSIHRLVRLTGTVAAIANS